MGIKQLTALLKKVAPNSVSNWHSIDDYKGKTIAIDASPCLYQCLTTSDHPGSEADKSHIIGFLRRTVRLLELGIKPVFVFDGKSPAIKKTALTQRQDSRARSQELLEEAEAKGDREATRRYAARLVKATQRHNEEVIEMLQLMGLPAVQAPSEAECLCCHLAKAGRVDSVATEDMDALVFGAPQLLRYIHQGATQASVHAVQEINIETVLSSLRLCHSEFIDLCILAGCDYLGTIERVGVHTAYQLISKHRTIESVLDHLDRSKHKVPSDWDYAAARAWFKAPTVGDVASICLEQKAMQEEKLRKLLVDRHQLNAATASEYIQRLARVAGATLTATDLVHHVPAAVPTPLRANPAPSFRIFQESSSPMSGALQSFIKSFGKRSFEDASIFGESDEETGTSAKCSRTVTADMSPSIYREGCRVSHTGEEMKAQPYPAKNSSESDIVVIN